MALYAIGCMLENKRRDKLQGSAAELSINDMLDDLTDKEKPDFRYVY